MSTYSGDRGIIKIGSDTILNITDWTLSTSVASRNTSSLGGGSSITREFDGIKDSSGSFNCIYNPGDVNGQELLMEGTKATIVLYPAGDTTGLQTITVPIGVKEVSLAGGIAAENATRSITWEGAAELVRGTVA
jgi:hypothetical protein